MTNLECIIALLRQHREARAWTDEAVATDLLAQLGLEAEGEATNARPAADPSVMTEEEVMAHEAMAQQAADKAKEAREKLDAQAAADGAPPPAPTLHPSSQAVDLAPGTLDPNLPPVPQPDPALLAKPDEPEKPHDEPEHPHHPDDPKPAGGGAVS